MNALAVGIVSQATIDFQNKMQDRIRQAMGDLMPDEVLSQIVSQGIQDAFFKKRTREVPRYSSHHDAYVQEYDSWLVEFIRTEAEKQVKDAVKTWVLANESTFREVVETTLQKGLGQIVVQSFSAMFQNDLNQLRDGISYSLDKLRSGN